MGSVYRLTIPGTLPGLNEYINAERRNKYLGAKTKRQAQAVVVCCAKKQLRGVRLQKRVVMRYHWYERNRRRDMDNISSFGRKVIQDGLVTAGVLKNDGWKEIAGFSDAFAVDRKKPRIEIEIEVLEE